MEIYSCWLSLHEIRAGRDNYCCMPGCLTLSSTPDVSGPVYPTHYTKEYGT